MPKEGHTEEQIIAALSSRKTASRPAIFGANWELARGTFYLRGLGMQELQELSQLRDESHRLKRLVADLLLDKCRMFGWAS